jgi:8-oxo-dGTP pyrophosphatase MutT (NUDIX family)
MSSEPPEWLNNRPARDSRKPRRKPPPAAAGKDADSGVASSGGEGAGPSLPEPSPRRRSARELSAGGVVVRGEEVLVIVPTRRAADGSLVLALPKGHIDEGESRLAAATREVREETGVRAEPVIELGEVRYWYVHRGRRTPKSVFFFLFRYLSGDPADHDEEVHEARWMPLEQAARELSYAGEREMIARALAITARDR